MFRFKWNTFVYLGCHLSMSGYVRGRVRHICITPSHYLNQCWYIVDWTIANTCTTICIYVNAFQNIVCKMTSTINALASKWQHVHLISWLFRDCRHPYKVRNVALYICTMDLWFGSQSHRPSQLGLIVVSRVHTIIGNFYRRLATMFAHITRGLFCGEPNPGPCETYYDSFVPNRTRFIAFMHFTRYCWLTNPDRYKMDTILQTIL